MSEFGFEANPNTQLAPFGLTEGFIESLTPEDLRGVISAIAKYAATSRHPDRLGSKRVDYSFGNTDARTLTSIAGKLSQLSNEEVAEIQGSYSEDAVVEEYRNHILNLSETVEDQKEELRAVKTRGLELLIPDEDSETIDGFSGRLFSRRGILTPNITVLEVEKGGKIKAALEVSPLDKEFLKDADKWVQDTYRLAQTTTDKETEETLFIVSSAEGAKLRTGDGAIIDLTAAGIDVPTPSKSRLQRSNIPQLYLTTVSMNRKTGHMDKTIFVTYSLESKHSPVPANARVLGFMNSHNLYDLQRERTNNAPRGLLKLSGAPISTDKISKLFNQVSIDRFWALVIEDKQMFSRSLEASSDFAPIIYDPSNHDDCLALGQYYMAIRD